MALPRRLKSKMSSENTNIGSWNLNGELSSPYSSETMMQDMVKRGVAVACLQETWAGEYYYESRNKNGKIIGLDPGPEYKPHFRYGLGFYISNQWDENLWSIKTISNRIAIAQFIISKTESRNTYLTLINVYAPTSERTRKNPTETQAFYDQLSKTYKEYKPRSEFVIICGDFNSKIGLKRSNENFIGKYGKGTRNSNGEIMVQFLEEHNAYVTNSSFQHSMRHRTTWSKNCQGTMIYNMIDYIIIPQEHLETMKGLLKDSRSYDGTLFDSDHKLIITKFNLTTLYYLSNYSTKHNKQSSDDTFTPRDTSKLYESSPGITKAQLKPTGIQYQMTLNQEINKNIDPNEEYSPSERYEKLTQAIKSAAMKTLPEKVYLSQKYKTNYRDTELTFLIKEKRWYRKKRNNTRNNKLRKKYTKILWKTINLIKTRIRKLRQDRIEQITEELEQSKGNRRSFEAQRLLKTSKRSKLKLQNDNNEFIYDTQEKLNHIKSHYKSFFNTENANPICPWRMSPQPLDPPITRKDISEVTFKHLRNGRAAGPDQTQGELYKYGNQKLHLEIATIINRMFEINEEISSINHLILIPLNKPNKGFQAKNTRPIQLVNMIRKILSSLVLKEIQEFAEKYVSLTQSGYRPNRSTCDIIWTYRWFMAITEKYQETLYMMGIDLSKAFDCIDRFKLLQILEEGNISTNALRIIQYLISSTHMQCQVGKTKSETFDTTQGIPQGDALSPVLFIIYLEKIMRTFREKHPDMTDEQLITHYADDTDFWAYTKAYNDMAEQDLPQIMADFNMKMNLSKTEKITLSRETVKTLTNKKLGSKLSNDEDLNYKIMKACAAFHSMNKMWLDKTKISLRSKVRMYNVCVKSILLENIAPLAVTETKLEKIAATHRRHLRFLANIFHPRHITNEQLYKITETYDIRVDILNCRWKFFGHTLRSNDIPGKCAMEKYFTRHDSPRYKGMLPTSLPTILHHDLMMIGSSLKNYQDLKTQEELAQNRSAWQDQTRNLIIAARQKWENKRKHQIFKKKYSAKVTLTNKEKRITLLLHKPTSLIFKKRKHTVNLENGINLVYSQWESQGHTKKKQRMNNKKEENKEEEKEDDNKEEEGTIIKKEHLLDEFAVTFDSFGPQDFL